MKMVEGTASVVGREALRWTEEDGRGTAKWLAGSF